MALVPVPFKRGDLIPEDVSAGRAVRAITWQDYSQLAAWVQGRGGQLIAGCTPLCRLTTGRTYQVDVRCQPHIYAIDRVWSFWVVGTGTTASITITINGGTPATFPVQNSRRLAVPIVFTESLASQSSAVTTMAVEVMFNGGDGDLERFECYEVPRSGIDTGSPDFATEQGPFRASSPHRNADFVNAAGTTFVDQMVSGRRNLFSWGVPYLDNAAPTTTYSFNTPGAGFASIFNQEMPPSLGRKFGPSDTTRTVACHFLVSVSGGATGQVQMSTVHGVTGAPAFVNAAAAWVTTTAVIDGEDVASADGLQGAAWMLLDPQIRISAGAGTASCYAISVWE